MALETREKDLGDYHFAVEQLPYFRAQRLFTKLLRLAGPALASLFTLTGKAGAKAVAASLGDMDTSDLVPMLAAFFEKLHAEEVEELTLEILATTRVYYKEKLVPIVGGSSRLGVMDAVIGGDFWTGLMLQAFALQVHFGNFTSAREGFAALGLKASPSPESSTSTDGKGETLSAPAG